MSSAWLRQPPHADDEDQRQAERPGQVGAVEALAERHQEAADAFDHQRVGLGRQFGQCRAHGGRIHRHPVSAAARCGATGSANR